MSELGTIGNRQAEALIGVAPMDRESGTLKGARRIGGRRCRPSGLLYMAAMTAMTKNPGMKAINGLLRENGKHHKVVLLRDWRIRTEQALA